MFLMESTSWLVLELAIFVVDPDLTIQDIRKKLLNLKEEIKDPTAEASKVVNGKKTF